MIWLRISASPGTSESWSSRGRWQSFQKSAPSRSLSASCTNLRMTRSCHYSKVVQITGRDNLPSCRSSKTGISQRFVIRCSTISDNLSGIRTEGQPLRGRRSRREVMVRCWALSQFPYLVGPDLTIYEKAPPGDIEVITPESCRWVDHSVAAPLLSLSAINNAIPEWWLIVSIVTLSAE